MALYQAKSEGRGTWCWFEAKMAASAQARRNLEIDLRSALENEALEFYYQPLFNLKTKRISVCEALLRWPHHERGMVLPGELIPVAEEMELNVEIGNQMLYKACLECRQWPGDIAGGQPLPDPVRPLRRSGVRSGHPRRHDPSGPPARD